MDNTYFRKLFEYDFWSNRGVLSALQRGQNLSPMALQLLSHILAAERVWHTRLLGKDSSALSIWPNYSLTECERLTGEIYQHWMSFLEGLTVERLMERIHYKSSRGMVYETAIGDILTHVVIHGGYHRGQITALLRHSGEQPAITDFIYYVRNH